jgi:hypothetical protein
MPDAMINGGFSPYLAQAFTPQGVPGGVFGGGMGTLPTNIFGGPTFGQSFAQPGMLGGVTPFAGIPQWGQQYPQPYIGWQQQIPWQQQMPQFQPVNPLGQSTGWGSGLGWPYGQVQPGQYGLQTGDTAARAYPFVGAAQFGQSQNAGQEPLVLAHLLRQYAVPISAIMASPYAQGHIAQHLVQTADMLTRVLPLVGAPHLIPLAQQLGQNAVPISAAIASPYGQTQIAQNLLRTADILTRVLPVVSQAQMQPNIGWQQQLVPQLPIAQLLGQQPQQYWPQQTFAPFGAQSQFGQFPGQPGDALTRIMPYLAQQQGPATQGYYGLGRI